ncbi:MAG: hypothetical protein Q8Q21_00880 [bacterium]|nr:hypothetical protein [bacterium]
MSGKLFTPNKVLLNWRNIHLIKENAENVGILKIYLKENRPEVLNALDNLKDDDVVFYAEYNRLWCMGTKPDLRIGVDEIKKCPECGKMTMVSLEKKYHIIRCKGCGFCVVIRFKFKKVSKNK